MDELMKNISFSDGGFIPIANEENKCLEFEVQELLQNSEVLKTTLEEDGDKLTSIQKYVKNLQSEQGENQKLITAFDHQIQTDSTELNVVQSEIKNCSACYKNCLKESQERKEKQEGLTVENDRIGIRLDKLKAQLHWDHTALQAWDEEVARGIDDTDLLKEFTKQDNSRFNNLELQRQALRDEVTVKDRKLESLKDDVLCLEKALEKTGNLFQCHHNERQSLVTQWEASVRVLHQRDEDINQRMEEVGGLRAQAKQRMRELVEHRTFYENEVRNNKELERDVNKMTKEAHGTKETVLQLEKAVSDMYGEYLVLRGSLSARANAVQQNRLHCRRMDEDIYKKRYTCQKLIKRLESLHSEMEGIQSKNSSAADRVSQLECLKMNEEAATERIINDMNKLQEIIRGVSEELLKIRDHEAEQKSMMSGLEGNLHTVKKRTQIAMEEQQRHSEMLYAAEMTYVEKDMLYKKMLGTKNIVDNEEDENRVKNLEEAFSQCKATHDLLQNELYRLEQEHRRLMTALHTDEKELMNLRSKKQDNILSAEGAQKQLKVLQTSNQHRQVDENVIKLRVKQVTRAVDHVGDKLYTLEKQRLELEEAVKERGMEVQSLMDMLNVRKRILLEQVSGIRSKINASKLKVEHLRKRYEVNISSLGADDGAESQSVTYYKLKAAQERYELQQFGDKLDEKIRKTEKEIQAMENTLKLVNTANKSFKQKEQNQIDVLKIKIRASSGDENKGEVLKTRWLVKTKQYSTDETKRETQAKQHVLRTEADGELLEERESLENSYLEAINALRKKKITLLGLNEAMSQLAANMEAQVELENNITKDWKGRDAKAAELDLELVEQEEKLARAARTLRKQIKDVRGTQQSRFQTLEEKDIELREMLEQNQSALQQLSEVAARHAATGPVISRYLQDKGLYLPDVLSSLVTSSGRLSISSRSTGSVASQSCLTIDSTALDGVGSQKQMAKHGGSSKRSSILKSEKKHSKSYETEKKESSNVDITCESNPSSSSSNSIRIHQINNSLPNGIKSISSVTKFKQALSEFFQQQLEHSRRLTIVSDIISFTRSSEVQLKEIPILIDPREIE